MASFKKSKGAPTTVMTMVGDPKNGKIPEHDGKTTQAAEPQYAKFGKGVVPAWIKTKNAAIGVAIEILPSFIQKPEEVNTDWTNAAHSHNDGDSHHPTDQQIHDTILTLKVDSLENPDPAKENDERKSSLHKGNAPSAETFIPAESEAIEIELGAWGDIVINAIKLVIAEIGVEAKALSPTNMGDWTCTDMCIGEHTECRKGRLE